MKKTIVFLLMAAAIMFCACSNDSNGIVDDEPQKKGMKLNAVVPENLRSRATIGDTESDTWTFAFTNDDEAKVTNSNMSGYYTFTKTEEEFSCATAEPTSTAANWYAYFPSTEVSLTNQTGNVADVANKFALAGKTSSATTGEKGLTIHMDAKVAVLVIDNQKGAIDINIKNSADTWVTGLTAKANEAAFDVTTSTTKTSILKKSANGKYYIAVPAGVQLAVKNGDEVIKSTVAEGLEAGKYYTIELKEVLTYGCPDEHHPHYVDFVLPSGVKWACMNVGATSPEQHGDYFSWGATEPLYTVCPTVDGPLNLKGDKDGGYCLANTPYNTSGVYLWDKYVVSRDNYSSTGKADGKIVLDTEDDAACVNWEDGWRMPTEEELNELSDNTFWIWTTNYNNTGINGFVVYKPKEDAHKGRKKYVNSDIAFASQYSWSDTHIFLPTTGRCSGSSLNESSGACYYWSSTVDSFWPQYAIGWQFNGGFYNRPSGFAREVGNSIRPVRN